MGEIVFRGPTVMKGYYRNPGLTAEIIKDGWLYTGDMGRMDDDGYLYIVDRKKEMIVSGGLNIYPAEIERVLSGHAKIKEVAVIGVPHRKWGEAVKAVVRLRDNCRMDETELNEFCCQKMARFKRPRYVTFVEHLPKSPIGKILKKEVRAIYGQEEEQSYSGEPH